jgi:hypothetical protein
LSRGLTGIFSTRLKDLSDSVFVVWSERNDWFAITWSDGGAIGNFHTRVFHIASDKVNEAESVKTAFSDFRGRHWCKARGDNVQAYGWDEKTKALARISHSRRFLVRWEFAAAESVCFPMPALAFRVF